MKRFVKVMAMGFSWGFTVWVLILFVGVIINPRFLASMPAEDFIKHTICSAIVGLGWAVPTLVYSNEKLARGLQVLIHLGIGWLIYIGVALFAGWIPTSQGVMITLISIICALICSFVVYFCFYLYYKNDAKKMNAQIKSMKK